MSRGVYQPAPGLHTTTIYAAAFDDDAYTEHLKAVTQQKTTRSAPPQKKKASAAPTRFIQADYTYQYNFDAHKQGKGGTKTHKSSSGDASDRRRPVSSVIQSVSVKQLQAAIDRNPNSSNKLEVFEVLVDELERLLLKANSPVVNDSSSFWSSLGTPIDDANPEVVDFLSNWTQKNLNTSQLSQATKFLVQRLMQNAASPRNGSEGLGYRLMAQVLVREHPLTLLQCIPEIKSHLSGSGKGHILKKPYDQVIINLGGQLLASDDTEAPFIFFVELLATSALANADANLIEFGKRALDMLRSGEHSVETPSISAPAAIDLVTAIVNNKSNKPAIVKEFVPIFSDLVNTSVELVSPSNRPKVWAHLLHLFNSTTSHLLLIPLMNGICIDNREICSTWKTELPNHPENSAVLLDHITPVVIKALTTESKANLTEFAKDLVQYVEPVASPSMGGSRKKRQGPKPTTWVPSKTTDAIATFAEHLGVWKCSHSKNSSSNGRNHRRSSGSFCGGLFRTIFWLALWVGIGYLIWNSGLIPKEHQDTLYSHYETAYKTAEPHVAQAYKTVEPHVTQAYKTVEPHVTQAYKTVEPHIQTGATYVEPYYTAAKEYASDGADWANKTWTAQRPFVIETLYKTTGAIKKYSILAWETSLPYLKLAWANTQEGITHMKPFVISAWEAAQPTIKVSLGQVKNALTLGKQMDLIPGHVSTTWKTYAAPHVNHAVDTVSTLVKPYTTPVVDATWPYIKIVVDHITVVCTTVSGYLHE